MIQDSFAILYNYVVKLVAVGQDLCVLQYICAH